MVNANSKISHYAEKKGEKNEFYLNSKNQHLSLILITALLSSSDISLIDSDYLFGPADLLDNVRNKIYPSILTSNQFSILLSFPIFPATFPSIIILK